MQYQHRKGLKRRFGGVALVLALTVGNLVLSRLPVLAQLLAPEVREAFLSSPLDDEPLDPLLPTPPVRRPLSPLEQYQLEQDLDELALQAEALATADEAPPGQTTPGVVSPDPNEIWMREVRLRRLLGLNRELAALKRVAQWMRDRTSIQELQLLTARLREIQSNLESPTSKDQTRLMELAEIYAILGEVNDAAAIHRTLAETALAIGDEAAFQAQLETLANLQASWFYFDDAAATYSELLELAQLESSRANEIQYLKAQSRNLEQAQQFEQAITSQKQLLTLYNETESLWSQVPTLQQDIAANYIALGDLSEASRYFRSAYTNALAQLQFNIAAGSIRSLAEIYISLERWDDVRYLYEQLIGVERQAKNAFGVMTAFDALGQLYEQLGEPEQALEAYREGLGMARSLGHREAYFEAQITRLVAEE